MNIAWPTGADKGRDLYEKFAAHVRQEKATEVPLFYSLSSAMRRVWDNLAAQLESETDEEIEVYEHTNEDWSDDDD